ncbi:MAG: type IV toxin-antitoxin system AbiEi family antitoxin domain-containing protein [Actinomycetota bacterium]|nr:type IV toxin-antitoxin system AbiEi family antitoxin domain-containing protein [Actinomycetota bacterium]
MTTTALRAIAEGQHGLVTTSQAGAVGVSRRRLHSMRAGGQLVRAHRGVYRFTGTVATRQAQVLAAVLAAGPRAVVSHQTAAALLGLGRLGEPDLVHVCLQDTTPQRVEGVTVHRTVDMPPCDVTDVVGVPVTSGARTLVDLAAVLGREDLTALTDDAVCAGVAPRPWLYRRARALRPGRAGVQRLLTLTAPGAEGTFRSWLERRAGALIAAHGLPQPRWNVPVHDGDGLIGIVDALYGDRLVLEFEGLRFHTTPRQRRADADRFNRLQLVPLLVQRFTWLDVVEQPTRVVARIRHSLQASQGTLSPGLPQR